MRDDQRVAVRAGRREWIALAVIALPCLLYAMDLTVLYLAVPSLTRDLEPSSAQLLWITDIYGFLVAGWLITMGRLGDRIGRRRLLLIGAAAFGAASVLAAFSTSAGMLIVARALLGIAGATLAPSTLSLIRNIFADPRERTVAIGVWAASFSAGAALGPVLGGALLELFWWGSVFLLAVPVMVLLLVVGPRLLPEYRDPDPGRFDIVSAILSLVSVLAVVYGLKLMAQDGITAQAALSAAAGLAIGVVFLRRQTTLADPLLDLTLFRAPAFNTALAANTLGIFVIGGTELFISQYLQIVLGMSPLQAGLWTLPSAGGFIVGSMLAPALVRRIAPAHVVSGGLAVGAAGLALLTLVQAGSGLPLIVAGSVVMAVGAAQAVTLGTDLIVSSAPAQRAGAASSISETGAELGGALGVALLGSIGTAVYRAQLADAVPAGVPSDAANAARDTVGGAAEAAGQLPAGVLDTAFRAFTDGLQIAGAVSASAMALMAVLTLVFLGRPPAAARAPRAATAGARA
jgi:MFS transporter, DHA2 family, multidrug resistance protein